MKIPRRRFLHLAAGAAALPAVSRIARAQTYPSRPITIVAGFAAGGATDTIGRVIAERMKGSLGQPVIVEDVTGAGETWMAFVSPSMAQRGEWNTHPPIVTAQVAATLIEWMGGDWKLFDPAAAPPVSAIQPSSRP